LRFRELREFFSSVDVEPNDWILEKPYGPMDSPINRIPTDIEDILLLLRLFHAGELAFIKLVMEVSGVPTVARSYRAMNDVNSFAGPLFEIDAEKCELWKGFAAGVRESPSWSSDWFATARRFFLSGGAKRFNPRGDDVDRIVDYATALESVLVPEEDYSTARTRCRAAALIAPDDAAKTKRIVKIVNQFYRIHSRIVHGSKLDAKMRKWLEDNRAEVELRVREVLVAALRDLPPGEGERRVALARLYDPTDEDRRRSTVEMFRKIKTEAVKKSVANEISKLSRQSPSCR
jgi:hypothetical protein